MNAILNTHENDYTRARIRAFLRSMRPLRGVSGAGESDEYQLGRTLIERLADSATCDDYPTLRFTSDQCAQVLEYLRVIEPIHPANWWDDPKDAPSHTVGFQFIVFALAQSLRSPAPAASDVAAECAPEECPRPKSLSDRLAALRTQLFEMMSIIEVSDTHLSHFDGDEDSLKIVEQLSVTSYALQAARRFGSQIAEEMEHIQHDLSQQPGGAS